MLSNTLGGALLGRLHLKDISVGGQYTDGYRPRQAAAACVRGKHCDTSVEHQRGQGLLSHPPRPWLMRMDAACCIRGVICGICMCRSIAAHQSACTHRALPAPTAAGEPVPQPGLNHHTQTSSNPADASQHSLQHPSVARRQLCNSHSCCLETQPVCCKPCCWHLPGQRASAAASHMRVHPSLPSTPFVPRCAAGCCEAHVLLKYPSCFAAAAAAAAAAAGAELHLAPHTHDHKPPAWAVGARSNQERHAAGGARPQRKTRNKYPAPGSLDGSR
jgi:hypothetical protein